MTGTGPRGFWHDAFAWRGSVGPRVIRLLPAFGGFAALVSFVNYVTPSSIDFGVDIIPLGIAAGVLGLVLVARTTAGYDRWWEGRKLWGGVVNQSRNLAIGGLGFGPADKEWREQFVRWTAAFGHATRATLRGERELPEIAALLGPEAARRIAAAPHMPSFIALQLSHLLREAFDEKGMSHFAFQQIDRERALLIDYVGGCERIARSPMPGVQAGLVRQFIIWFLATLPFALMKQFEPFWMKALQRGDRIFDWLAPIVTMIIAYPILALDQVGHELQNPFSLKSLSHLPLDEITHRIERDLLALLAADGAAAHVTSATPEAVGGDHRAHPGAGESPAVTALADGHGPQG